MKNIINISEQPQLENPSLIVGWNSDTGKLSPAVIDYLNSKINTKSFCEIEPAPFFSLAGVEIFNDVAQFPENKFYYSQKDNLVIFKGTEPQSERYKFLSAILDVAEHHCNVKQLITINGTISSIAHTSSRKILTVFNQQDFQKDLRDYGLEDMNWQGPPAISSYLLWVAEKRGISGASLWPEIPFYLANGTDFIAIKLILSFLDRRFGLALDLKELDEQISSQNLKIDQLKEENSEINRYIATLESGLPLNGEEQMQLIKGITKLFKSA